MKICLLFAAIAIAINIQYCDGMRGWKKVTGKKQLGRFLMKRQGTKKLYIVLKSAHKKWLSARDNTIFNDKTDISQKEQFEITFTRKGFVALKTWEENYFSAQLDGRLEANREKLGNWEKFRMYIHGDNILALKSIHGKWLSAQPNGRMEVNRKMLGSWEKFYGLSKDGDSVNIALRKPTAQSSIGWTGDSSRAVDGNVNTIYSKKSCTHTEQKRGSWWMVDLAGQYVVNRVAITNRGDCCWKRLRNFEVRVGYNQNSAKENNKLCVAVNGALGRGETRILKCVPPVEGRFVFVVNNVKEFLTLCEVQVFGKRGKNPVPTPVECRGKGTVYDKCAKRCKCVNGMMTSCHRVRKDFTSMTSVDRARYIRTFKAASTSPLYKEEFNALIKLHSDLFATKIHQKVQFLPWHRWYLLQLENLLRKINCKVTVPYWDWSLFSHDPWSTSHLWRDSDDGFGGNGVPPYYCVTNGPFAKKKWKVAPSARGKGTCLRRQFNGTFPDAAAVDIVLNISPSQYPLFDVGLRVNLHDTVHCRFSTQKGMMCSRSSASAPEFFLHHGFVDKLWADWQKKSIRHKIAFFGKLNTKMTKAPVSPSQMLDLSNLGGGVRVVYDDPTHDGLKKTERYLKSLSSVKLMNMPREWFSGISNTAERLFRVKGGDRSLARKVEKKILPHNIANKNELSKEESVIGFKMDHNRNYGK